ESRAGAAGRARRRRRRAVRQPLPRPLMSFAVVTPGTRFEELVDKLPPLVSAKYRRLEEERDPAHGALVANLARWQDAQRELRSAEATAAVAQDGDRRDVDRFNRARQSGTPQPPSGRCLAAEAALARARDRAGSRRQAKEQAEVAWQVADRLLAA